MIDRRPAIAELLEDRKNALVVAGLGSPVYDVFSVGDHNLNFYNWGAMGSAGMVGSGWHCPSLAGPSSFSPAMARCLWAWVHSRRLPNICLPISPSSYSTMNSMPRQGCKGPRPASAQISPRLLAPAESSGRRPSRSTAKFLR